MILIHYDNFFNKILNVFVFVVVSELLKRKVLFNFLQFDYYLMIDDFMINDFIFSGKFHICAVVTFVGKMKIHCFPEEFIIGFILLKNFFYFFLYNIQQ